MMKVLVALLFLALGSHAKPEPGILAPALLFGSSQYHSQDQLGQYSYGYTNPQSSKAEVKTADGITQGSYSYIDAEGKLQHVQYTSDEINGFRVAATNLPAPVLNIPVINNIEDSEVILAKSKHPDIQSEEAKDEKYVPVPALKSQQHQSVVTYHGPAPFLHPVAHIAAPGFAYATASYGFPQLTYFKHLAPLFAATPYYTTTTTTTHHISQSAPASLPQAPAETPEVAKARADHLKAHEEVKARNV